MDRVSLDDECECTLQPAAGNIIIVMTWENFVGQTMTFVAEDYSEILNQLQNEELSLDDAKEEDLQEMLIDNLRNVK